MSLLEVMAEFEALHTDVKPSAFDKSRNPMKYCNAFVEKYFQEYAKKGITLELLQARFESGHPHLYCLDKDDMGAYINEYVNSEFAKWHYRLLHNMPTTVMVTVESGLMAEFEEINFGLYSFEKTNEGRYTDIGTLYAYYEWYKRREQGNEIARLTAEIEQLKAERIKPIELHNSQAAQLAQRAQLLALARIDWRPSVVQHGWTQADEEIRREERRQEYADKKAQR